MFKPAAVAIAGSLVVMGGWNRQGGALASVEAYDGVAGVWVGAAPMGTARRWTAAVAVM